MNATATAPPPQTAEDRRQTTDKPAREYKLVPVTKGPLPARAERLLVQYLKLQERAGEMFREAAAKLETAMKETHRGEPAIKPGVVYAFRNPVATNKGVKRTVQVKDNFAQPQVSKLAVFNRWGIEMWAGDGPVKDRAARAEGAANSNKDEEDALP